MVSSSAILTMDGKGGRIPGRHWSGHIARASWMLLVAFVTCSFGPGNRNRQRRRKLTYSSPTMWWHHTECFYTWYLLILTPPPKPLQWGAQGQPHFPVEVWFIQVTASKWQSWNWTQIWSQMPWNIVDLYSSVSPPLQPPRSVASLLWVMHTLA